MICNVCGSNKAPTYFYKNDRTCKLCRCAKVRANRASKIDYYRGYDKKRGFHNSEDNTARCKFPNQYKAQNAVNNAIRDGRLVKRPCEVCYNTNVHAHHDDYNKPLEVRWLCPIHHKEWHDKNGEALNRK